MSRCYFHRWPNMDKIEIFLIPICWPEIETLVEPQGRGKYPSVEECRAPIKQTLAWGWGGLLTKQQAADCCGWSHGDLYCMICIRGQWQPLTHEIRSAPSMMEAGGWVGEGQHTANTAEKTTPTVMYRVHWLKAGRFWRALGRKGPFLGSSDQEWWGQQSGGLCTRLA